MEMVGVPREWLADQVDLLIALLEHHDPTCEWNCPLAGADRPAYLKVLQDKRAQLRPPTPSKRATLDKPVGSVGKVLMDKTLHQASSIGASPSWSVSHG